MEHLDRHGPVEIAPETFVIQAAHRSDEAPVAIHLNAMVIRSDEPVLVDCGAPINREQYLEDVFGLVEPEDVQWVFISHEDMDHIGNLEAVMARCPNATLVASWYLFKRLEVDPLDVPLRRWRWVNDGETLDVGDRCLAAIRPPLYDSPTTRGLFDPTTGVYWAADCFATTVPNARSEVGELDLVEWEEGFSTFQSWNSPWLSLVDGEKFSGACEDLAAHGVQIVASAHSPTIGRPHVQQAFDMLRRLPGIAAREQPGQAMLDQLVSSMGDSLRKPVDQRSSHEPPSHSVELRLSSPMTS